MLRSIALSLALCLFVSTASAGVLFDQQTGVNPAQGPSAISMNDDLGEYARAYDDFILPFDSKITDLHWFGAYTEIPFAGLPDRVTGFQIQFYGDAAGAPGALLYNETVSVAQANEVFEGTAPASVDPVNLRHDYYSYMIDPLPVPFMVTGGARTWLSIVGIAPSSNNSFWDWRFGTNGNNIAFQDFDVENPFGIVDVGEGRLPTPDFAFQLTGEVVPEPASAVIWLGAIGVGVVAARRRKKQANS